LISTIVVHYTTLYYYFLFSSYLILLPPFPSLFFFFNAPPTTEIYTLSLHDALPISMLSQMRSIRSGSRPVSSEASLSVKWTSSPDRKSTRLNSSHSQISYAVFCLKKKKKKKKNN